MLMLTRLFLLLTVLALLPFGSFAASFGTPLHNPAVISAQLHDTAITSIPTGKTFASTLKRCKGPALPGSPCNPALAVWPTEVTLAFDSPASRLQLSDLAATPGQTPPFLLGPPRLG